MAAGPARWWVPELPGLAWAAPGSAGGRGPSFHEAVAAFPHGRSAVGSCALVQLFSFLWEGHPGHRGRLGRCARGHSTQ